MNYFPIPKEIDANQLLKLGFKKVEYHQQVYELALENSGAVITIVKVLGQWDLCITARETDYEIFLRTVETCDQLQRLVDALTQ